MNTQHEHKMEPVLSYLRRFKDLESRVARAVREAIDLVIDGRHTGRYSIDQLDKTEKTYIGTKVEHFLLNALNLPKFQQMDTRINGIEVDIKFTIGSNWTIPAEAVGEICILVRASERKSVFSLGVIHITADRLNTGKNKDGKRTLNAEGRKSIYWVIEKGVLPNNLLLDLPQDIRNKILSHTSGTQRMAALFRYCTYQVIDGVTVETVGRQRDSSKRIRSSGGARSILLADGIEILSHYDNERLVELGLQPLKQGEFISIETGKPKHQTGQYRHRTARQLRIGEKDDRYSP